MDLLLSGPTETTQAPVACRSVGGITCPRIQSSTCSKMPDHSAFILVKDSAGELLLQLPQEESLNPGSQDGMKGALLF